MGEKLLVSPSPHVRAKGKTSLIMLMVIVALLPSCVYGVLNFGMHALLILVLVFKPTGLFGEKVTDKV